jgi:hypothetical protein
MLAAARLAERSINVRYCLGSAAVCHSPHQSNDDLEDKTMERSISLLIAVAVVVSAFSVAFA